MIVTAIRCDGINCSESTEIPSIDHIDLPSGWLAVQVTNYGFTINRKTTIMRDKHYCGITCCSKAVASLLGE